MKVLVIAGLVGVVFILGAICYLTLAQDAIEKGLRDELKDLKAQIRGLKRQVARFNSFTDYYESQLEKVREMERVIAKIPEAKEVISNPPRPKETSRISEALPEKVVSDQQPSLPEEITTFYLTRLIDDVRDKTIRGDKLWKLISGKLVTGKAKNDDKLIEKLKDLAKEGQPNRHIAYYLLGLAYAAKISKSSTTDQIVENARNSQKSLDKSLELEPTFWDAKYAKAVNYSYYPIGEGGPAKAIKEAKELLKLQRTLPHDNRFRLTYALLGRVYLSIGESEKARGIILEGLSLYPESKELKKLQGVLAAQE